MEVVEEIVIVGGGVAGLATSLGLHRYPLTLSFVCIGVAVSVIVRTMLQVGYSELSIGIIG